MLRYEKPLIVAGPCGIESEEQAYDMADAVERLGVKYFRANLFKPRTSPHSWQGIREQGAHILRGLKQKHPDMYLVSEVMEKDHVDLLEGIVDVYQVGSRNMRNYSLLEYIDKKSGKPVLLKRGDSATIEEIVGSIGYLAKNHPQREIILVERGIRKIDDGTDVRNSLDVNMISFLKNLNFDYPILVDPSHAIGRAEMVDNAAYAGIGAGADGVMIEVKRNQDTPKSDAEQAIPMSDLNEIIEKVRSIYRVVNDSG